MAQKRVGVIPYRSGQQADPFKIPVRDPIAFIDLVLTGILTVTVAITLVEDDILNLLRRVQILLGGKSRKSIGDNSRYGAAGKLLYFADQALYGMIPEYIAPGTGVAAHAFKAVLRIPVQMPELLSRNIEPKKFLLTTAMQPGTEDLEMLVDWGTTADVFSAGTASFTTEPSLEVVVGYEPALAGVPQSFDFQEVTQSLALASGAGANPDFTDDLNKLGIAPYALLLGVNNSLRANAIWNRIGFKVNEQLDILDASWDYYQNAFKANAGLQATAAPTGVGLALYDQQMDGSGFLMINDPRIISAWKSHIDHDALTAVNRFYVHQYALVAR